jgi:hypothetical protein
VTTGLHRLVALSWLTVERLAVSGYVVALSWLAVLSGFANPLLRRRRGRGAGQGGGRSR